MEVDDVDYIDEALADVYEVESPAILNKSCRTSQGSRRRLAMLGCIILTFTLLHIEVG